MYSDSLFIQLEWDAHPLTQLSFLLFFYYRFTHQNFSEVHLSSFLSWGLGLTRTFSCCCRRASQVEPWAVRTLAARIWSHLFWDLSVEELSSDGDDSEGMSAEASLKYQGDHTESWCWLGRGIIRRNLVVPHENGMATSNGKIFLNILHSSFITIGIFNVMQVDVMYMYSRSHPSEVTSESCARNERKLLQSAHTGVSETEPEA